MLPFTLASKSMVVLQEVLCAAQGGIKTGFQKLCGVASLLAHHHELQGSTHAGVEIF